MTNKKDDKKPTGLSKYPRLKWTMLWVGIPLLIYFIVFCILTWPWITHFGNYYFTDTGDGLQNVWNMWWINKAVTQLQELPWYTGYLHFPFGVTLIGQTLNPFNGFAGIVLQQFMSLNQAYNVMVIFSFIMGGTTAFWLAYYFSKSYVPSLVGGAVFTFSSYHMAHASGHMQLVSLEWMPLFILLWWMFVKKPSYWLAVGSSVSLLLVLLCDYYYFLYCLMTAVGIVGYLWYRKEIPDLRSRKTWLPIITFLGVSLLIIAPLPLALLRANATTEFLGSHPARMFSTDVLTPFLNGGMWYFNSLTEWYWRYIPGNIFETTVYFGVSVLIVLVISLFIRKKLVRDLIFWQVLIVAFGILSLGPRLMVRGHTIERLPMPYVIMERVVPGMKLSGMPIRMMVMVTLGSAVIVALVLARLKLSTTKGRLILAAFVVVFLFEMFPRPLPLTSAAYPQYVVVLKSLPATGGTLDEAATSEPYQLFNQTQHEQPIAFGYVSRLPKEVQQKEFPIFAYNQENKFDRLCKEFRIRYYTTPTTKPRDTGFPIIYQDDTAIIYDLKNSPEC